MSNEKKRKSTSAQQEQPSKKQHTSDVVKVHHVHGSEISRPIVVSSPGITIPNDIRFQTFAKKSTHNTGELILHSSDHPTIDFSATERSTPGEKYLKHYVAVFDQESGNLHVTEARHMVVRRSVRQIEAAEDDEEEQEDTTITNYSSRAALTEAFGTKKSKRAVQSMAENRQLGQGSEGTHIAEALSSHIADQIGDDEAMNSRSNKPLPKANLSTDEIEEVYPLDELVFPNPAANTLERLHPGPWIARFNAKKEINTRTRFVANRVGYIGSALLASPTDPKLIRSIRLLRYIELLIEINSYLSRLNSRQPIPFPDKWPAKTISSGTPTEILRPIISHFFPDRKPTAHAMTLLRTTILALALHIPPPSFQAGPGVLVTEPTDLALDIAMEAAEIRKLYRELGCKVEGGKDKELQLWKIERRKTTKEDKDTSSSRPAPVFAKLKLPLEFPKVSRGRPASRR